jgi:regulator of protease activity HflC (stomatin/prohibitin superfamily)
MGISGVVVAGFLLVALLKSMIVIIKQYERGVVLFLGKLEPKLREPGLQFVIPIVQKLTVIDQRTVTMDVPSQDVITKDNVSVKVNAVLFFRVMDPARALVQVENYLYATSMIAQTTLRSVCGEADMDDLLQNREELNKRIQEIVDQQTDPWGVKVSSVEIKHIDLPQEMQRAMAKQAEAERDRRSKIIQAEGEYQSAGKLKDAADIMAQNPITVQLRYLDTLKTISTENSSTVIFPMPINIMDMFGKKN